MNISGGTVFGKIGTMLGQNNINIATMQVSRNVQGGKAMMFLTIDSEPTNGDLDKIATVDGILKVQFVRL